MGQKEEEIINVQHIRSLSLRVHLYTRVSACEFGTSFCENTVFFEFSFVVIITSPLQVVTRTRVKRALSPFLYIYTDTKFIITFDRSKRNHLRCRGKKT